LRQKDAWHGTPDEEDREVRWDYPAQQPPDALDGRRRIVAPVRNRDERSLGHGRCLVDRFLGRHCQSDPWYRVRRPSSSSGRNDGCAPPITRTLARETGISAGFT